MIRKAFFIIGALTLFMTAPENAVCALPGSDQLTLTYEARLSGKVYDFALDAEGDYYLAESWATGDVMLLSGEKVTGERLKYNAYLDELIWLSPGNHQSVQIDKRLVSQFSVTLPGEGQPRVFHRLFFHDDREQPHAEGQYAELLYDGDVSLFAHRRVVQSGERVETVGGSLRAIPQLNADPVYYIMMPDERIKELSRFSRRALQGIFPDKQREVRALLRREQPMIRSEADLIRAVFLIEENILF